MLPRLQNRSRLPFLLCGASVVTLLAVPFLCSGRTGGLTGGAPVTDIVAFKNASDEPATPIGEDHWTDAELARNVISQWLFDAPGSPTVTISRREVVWVRSLAESASRQALAVHRQSCRKPVHPHKHPE